MKKVSNKRLIIYIILTIILLVLVIIYFIKSTNDNINYNKNNNKILQNSSQQESNTTVQNQNIFEITKDWTITAKPIIYLYPEQETEVTVKLGREENLTHTYPKYENGWKVTAKPNGELKDIKTGRSYYALYWEGINKVKVNMEVGFIVKGKDTIKFLEEKLKVLGLNERETNEFIIYWLPKLEKNKYNYIRFQTEEEINTNMALEINPRPDTIIRVVMEFKSIEKPMEIKEQELKTPTRTGFTVVEWGGTELN